MQKTLAQRMEDHALEPVPKEDRKSWIQLSWSTVGIVTTLLQLYLGAFLSFTAGIKIALIAGFLIAIIGSALGWAAGHIAFKSGLSSSPMARQYGLGVKGSVIISGTFAFMLIGFIAAENVLLYNGFLFYSGIEDSLMARIACFGALTVAWISLTAFGFEQVSRVTSIMLISFLGVLAYMLFVVIDTSGIPVSQVLSFPSQFPPEALESMGAVTDRAKLIFSMNVLAGTAGALALVDADLGRYARTGKDIAIAAILSNFMLSFFMIAVGATIMYAGVPALVEYYVTTQGLSEAAAKQVAIENPDRIVAAFVIFGGVLGTLLMVAANSKAQVINTYSSSLALSNFFDVTFNWRPGRIVFVIGANVAALFFLGGEFLVWFKSFLVILGTLTTSIATVIAADYFVARTIQKKQAAKGNLVEPWNWAGVLTVGLSFGLAHFALAGIIKIQVLTAIATVVIVYPLLRLFVFKSQITANGT